MVACYSAPHRRGVNGEITTRNELRYSLAITLCWLEREVDEVGLCAEPELPPSPAKDRWQSPTRVQSRQQDHIYNTRMTY